MMRNIIQKTLTLAVPVALIIAAAGCQEQNLSNTKKSRLVANENKQLKEQLERCHRQTEECLQDKEACEERSTVSIKNLADFLLLENKKLTEDNQRLKEQIEQLRKEMEQHKGR